MRWKGKPVCPHCSSQKSYRLEKTKSYRCANKDCKKTYTVFKGTIFENSNVPLTKWFEAICIVSSHKKGVSSHQLAKDIGVTQTTAWHILHRIRTAMNNNDLFIQEMEGIIELDETFVGGKNKNRHWDKKVKNSQGRSFKDKTPVFGLLERTGFVRCIVVPDTSAFTLQPLVAENVKMGATLMTDEWKAYNGLNAYYDHFVVDHGRGQYVNGDCYTNGLENFWSMLKRGIIGIYHKVSRKHLQKYCNEISYRFNTRMMSDIERVEQSLLQISGCGLKFKDLIAA